MKLAFEQHGQGPDLVVLHGLFGSARNWRSHVRTLSQSMRVTVVDLRNHGQSPHHPEMTYDAMANDLRMLLADEGLEQAAVLGHSMGGKAVMTMALQDPEWQGPMIVADIAPVAYLPRFQHVLRGLGMLPVASLQSRGEADALLAKRVADPALRTFLLTNLVRDGNGFKWRINLPAIVDAMPGIEGFGHYDDTVSSPVPSLFLRGSRSLYIADEGRAAIKRLFPNAVVEKIPDAGHWVHADQPELLVQAVLQFLGQS